MLIPGSAEASIQVDGVDIPFSATASFEFLVNQSVNVLLPTTRISMIDASGVFDKNVPLNDGSTLNLTIGDGFHPVYNIPFRVFGTPPRKPVAGGLTQFIIHGIYDAIPYVRANPLKPITGNATNAIANIAQNVGLKMVNNVNTNDQMNWMPGRKTWSGFASHITQHSMASDSSLMHLAVNTLGELHFHDVTQLFSQAQIKANISYGKLIQKDGTKTLAALEYTAENHSGRMNNTHGYGYRVTQSNSLTGAIQKFSNVKAMSINNVIDMSKTILGEIGTRGRIDIPRIATGNTHPDFIQAHHQNTRLRATYSQNVYVLLPQASNLTLFDMVNFSAVDSQGADDSVNGLYSITNISYMIKNRQYREKLQLTSAGPQNSNSSLV